MGQAQVPEITHDNHFVPQWYLKNWADGSGKVWTYRLLVPDIHVKAWQQRVPRGVAFERDLYTSVDDERESDEFEHWLEREFEAPAQAAMSRVLGGLHLYPHHLQPLGRYALCQQLRTPQYLMESMHRWSERLPGLLEGTLGRSIQRLEQLRREGASLPRPAVAPGAEHLDGMFKLEIHRPQPDESEGAIGVRVLVGRELWLKEQRHLLKGRVGSQCARHSWSIAEPAGDAVWFTSDQPVALLSYSEQGWDLNGGWGRPNGNIVMPLSPRHLLLAEVGKTLPLRMQLTQHQTQLLSEVLAKRAHRLIIAKQPSPHIEKMRPRVVDRRAYEDESQMWKQWHVEQTRAQREFEGWESPG